MAKRATSRKKSVMQEVHPDVADKIEIFTDPERIEKARARIVDYAKVAEQFADTAVLPDEDDEEDIFAQPTAPATAVVPVATPIAPVLNNEDTDLLADLEGLDGQDEDPAVTQVKPDDSFDDFGDLDDLLRNEPATPSIAPVTTQDEQDDPFADDAFPDFDQDLLSESDANGKVSGAEAFHDTTTSADDEDDIFGIPSVSSEPTPYGDRPSRDTVPTAQEDEDLLAGLNFGDDDVPDDADAALDAQPKNQGRAYPAWMEEDDDDLPDVFDAQRRAAETDQDEQGLFDDEQSPSETRDVRSSAPASSAALADLMGIPEDEPKSEEPASEETAVVVAPLVAEREDKPKKKGMFAMFSRNKKTEKTVVAETAEGDVVETTTVSETIETPEGVEEHEAEVVVKTEKKKKSKLPLAVSALALLAALGTFYVLDPLNVFQPAQPVVIQSNDRPPLPGEAEPTTAPVIAPATPDVSETDTTDIAPPILGDVPPETSATPDGPQVIEGADPIVPDVNGPEISATPDGPQIVDDSLDALDVPEVPAPEAVDPVLSDTPIAPVTEPAPEADLPVEPVTDDLSLAPEAPVEGDVAIGDEAQPDVFSDLYGAGISETEAERADAAQTLARVVQLTDLIEEQGSALDSALNRVKTLEAILTERDTLLAAAQGEAETARVTAEEAKEMAMAQNKILIEVVGIQDKMKIAEDLIVDLSKRTAAIEADDSQASQIRQLNERITEVTRDVGLLARTVLTNGQNLADRDAAQRAADRAYEEAQAAVDANAQSTMDRQTQSAPAGSSGVYGNEQRLMTTPSQQEATEIPATVKIGDEIPVYGEVLDIVENQDGSRLVVMENSSKIIPRAE